MQKNHYNGGKSGTGTYQSIINEIPPHSVYSEWFAGFAAIYRKKKLADISILFDVSRKSIQFLRSIVQPGDIVQKCDVILGLNFLVTYFNGLSDSGHSVFVYLDPPYLMSSRKSQKRIYDFELTYENHVSLLSAILQLNCNVAISCYDNCLYSEKLSTWRKVSFRSVTRAGLALETLYCNYPEPTELHDYSYIGSSFRERERFSRIRRNMISKFDSMPAVLRNSIFNELSNH